MSTGDRHPRGRSTRALDRARALVAQGRWGLLFQVLAHKARNVLTDVTDYAVAIVNPPPGVERMVAALPTNAVKRALWFIPTLVAGGSEEVDLVLLDEMKRAGWSVVVCVETQRGAQWRDRFLEKAAALIVLDEWVIGGRSVIAAASTLAAAWKPNLAVVRHSRVGYATINTVKRGGGAAADIIHATQPFGDWVDDAAPYADALNVRIATTQSVKDALITRGGAAAQSVTFVRNGIDLARLPGLAEIQRRGAQTRRTLGIGDAPVVGFLGRLSAEKNLDRWLSVAARVRARLPTAQFVIVGDGPRRAALARRVAASDLAATTHVVGACADPYAYYGCFDAFLLMSDYEGMPMSVLEALCSGVPAVTTAVGDLPSVLHDPLGETAPIEAGDETFASAISAHAQAHRCNSDLAALIRVQALTAFDPEQSRQQIISAFAKAAADYNTAS